VQFNVDGKYESFSGFDSFVFAAFVAPSSGSADFTDDLCNS
jgi:hypothetical protein